MAKLKFIPLLLLFSLSGCEKKPRTLFDYGGCSFVGEFGVSETAVPESGQGSLRRFPAGTPVKIAEYRADSGVFRIVTEKGEGGWCDAYQLEFGLDVFDFLGGFVSAGETEVGSIIERTRFSRLSEVNGALLDLLSLPGAEKYEAGFWRYLFSAILRHKIKENDFGEIAGKPCIYLKWVELDCIPGRMGTSFAENEIVTAQRLFDVPMGERRETALIFAVRHGNERYFDVALKNGWNLDATDKFGKTVFDYAAERGLSEIVRAKCPSS